jgi:hypothetical protein
MTNQPKPQDDQIEPGWDSRVTDWFGQSVQRDTELADELTREDDVDMDQAEADFQQVAHGKDDQDRRHGPRIDPDQGRAAYASDGNDPDSPGATIDTPLPAEPNEPG